MPRALILLMAVLVPLLAATSVSAAHRRHGTSSKCPPGHSHLLVADAQAQIYEKFAPWGSLEVYGCATSHRSYDLGGPEECGNGGGGGCAGVSGETLAGSVAAYREVHTVEEVVGGSATQVSKQQLVVRDLRHGRVLHRLSVVGFDTAPVLKADGAIAWIDQPGVFPSVYQVHAVDQVGSRLLASGTDIEPLSLALAGNTLYWTQSGRPFSASLN